MYIKKRYLFLFGIILFISIITIYSLLPKPGLVMAVSVSSDGQYALTSDDGRYIILWDVIHQKRKVISRHGNIYSAYFIKNTNKFMWQDLKDIVHIQDIQGKEILKFHNFPTYGQVITPDLKHYFASDQDWNLYSGYDQQQKIIKKAYEGAGFLGSGKLLNLTLSDNDQTLLTSGESGHLYDDVPLSVGINSREAALKGYEMSIRNESLLEGVVTWDVNTGLPLHKFPGNQVKTIATISPDGKYIIAGDEEPFAFVWNTQTGKRLFELADLNGELVTTKSGKEILDKSKLIKPPANYGLMVGLENEDEVDDSYRVHALKYIDQDHYLRFVTFTPWAILYQTTNPKPLKYLYLDNKPAPSVADYPRDTAIDTSPTAHILVTGQEFASGIIAYRYDPTHQTLQKIWVAS